MLIVAFGLAGTQPRPLWFVAMALAIGFGSAALRLVVPQVLETTWPARYDEMLTARRGRNSDNRTQFLATWVQESNRERRAGEGSMTFARRIQPLLLELTVDRLVHRHGIDPQLEPDRARALVGDQPVEPDHHDRGTDRDGRGDRSGCPDHREAVRNP